MENPSNKVAKVDPFDLLPDELLNHVVSFLPFKEAARAGSLGRRWRHRWMEHRRIDLDESVFTLRKKRKLLEADGRHSLAEGIRSTGRRHLVCFASAFAARYSEPRVESFRLAFSSPIEYAQEVREWVVAAAARGVEALELDFSNTDTDHPLDNYGLLDLPEEVYALRHSLRTMALTRCNVHPERFANLHALRSLTLSRTGVGRDSIDQLAAGCPHLEELYLDRVAGMGDITVSSFSRYLRVLHMNDCDPMALRVLIVQAPALQCFKYKGFLLPLKVEQVTTLEEVELNFLEDVAWNAGDFLCRLLLDLAMVKVLTVSPYLLQVIPFSRERTRLSSAMYKLRHLTLDGVTLHREELPGMAILMRSCPVLESLTIILCNKKKYPSLWSIFVPEGHAHRFRGFAEGAKFWKMHLKTPIPCVRVHLRYVNMEGFTGQISQLDVIEFILRAAGALREVNISVFQRTSMFGQTREQRFNIANTLLDCPRASADAKITIK